LCECLELGAIIAGHQGTGMSSLSLLFSVITSAEDGTEHVVY